MGSHLDSYLQYLWALSQSNNDTRLTYFQLVYIQTATCSFERLRPLLIPTLSTFSSIATLYDSNRSVGLSAKKGTCLLPSAHVLRIDECPASTCEELTVHTVAWKNKWLWQTCFLSTFICKLQRAFRTFSKCSGLCVCTTDCANARFPN